MIDPWMKIGRRRVVGTVLLMGPGWREPGVGYQDSTGEWVSPVDGSGFAPEPTHFAQFPEFKHIRDAQAAA